MNRDEIKLPTIDELKEYRKNAIELEKIYGPFADEIISIEETLMLYRLAEIALMNADEATLKQQIGYMMEQEEK